MDGFLALFSQYNIPGAFLVNIELTLWSALFSTILGVILVMMRISPIASLRTVSGAYVELFKNLPLTIIMVFMVLGAYAQLKLSFSDTFATNFFWLAVTGLSLYTAAFVCESLRSGINTVPIGQAEAARALGLGFMQSATEIILPQAFRGSVAPLGNTLIALLKNSTVAAAASVATETSSLMSEMIEFRPDVIIQIFLIFALGYVILIIPIGMLIGYFIVKAEPAVYVLNKQVEEVTDGAISAQAMGMALSAGVSISVGLAMVRVLTGISILWFLIPGYAVAIGISFVVPKLFTAIAFDAGGVASGPMTATFLLPLAQGACVAVGGNIVTDAFGVVAMVAMTPLITVQLMGLAAQLKTGRRRAARAAEPALAGVAAYADWPDDDIIEL